MTKMLKITLIWVQLRLAEGHRPKWRPSSSQGLSLRDGALAMAAVRIPMKHVEFLIESGANPSTHNWLAFRMAAANGDLEMLSRLTQNSAPSAYAVQDAMNWAHGKNHPAAVEFLRDLNSGQNPPFPA